MFGVPVALADPSASQARALQNGHLAAGQFHTCAVLTSGQVRCWGTSLNGQLGYGDTDTIGDDETPASVGPVDLGPGRIATAISASGRHTCADRDR